MKDSLDVPLVDVELLGELELVTNLIIAASESAEPMCPRQIDHILGVPPGEDN